MFIAAWFAVRNSPKHTLTGELLYVWNTNAWYITWPLKRKKEFYKYAKLQSYPQSTMEKKVKINM